MCDVGGEGAHARPDLGKKEKGVCVSAITAGELRGGPFSSRLRPFSPHWNFPQFFRSHCSLKYYCFAALAALHPGREGHKCLAAIKAFFLSVSHEHV